MKRSKMQQMSMEVTVGAFMFMVLLALGFFTIILSSENIFAPKHYREIVFDDVMGLRDGDAVTVRGFKVGKISRLWLMPDGVHLRISTDDPVDIREDYRAEILTSSVLGGKYLQITTGDTARPALPEDAILQGTSPVDLIGEATETFAGIRRALVDGGILADLGETMGGLRQLSANLNAGQGTLGKLLTDDAAYTNFVALSANLEAVARELREGRGTLGRLLADDEIYENLRATSERLREIGDRLTGGQGTLARLLSDDEALYQDIAGAVAALKDVAERLSSGEGTLGKLTTDDALYEEAQLLLQEIRAAVDDFRETAPITSFTSIFFGAL